MSRKLIATFWLLFATLAGALPLGSTAEAGSSVDITSSHFKYSGLKYFRGKAENIRLGSYGEKKTPFGGTPYLSVQANLTADSIAQAKVLKVPPIDIQWSKYSKTEVEGKAKIKFFKKGGARANFTHKEAKSANLKLMKFYINEGPLQNTLNNHANGARKYLEREGGDGRLVHEVWVVLSADLANHFENSVALSAKAGVGAGEFKLSGTTSSRKTETIAISPGTTFAYLLIKVKKWKNKRTRIADMEDDRKGMN